MVEVDQATQSEDEHTIPRRHELICAWSGLGVIVLMCSGLILAGLWPPTEPSASARDIQLFYAADDLQTRIGLVLAVSGVGLIISWGASIAAQTNRITTASPALTYVQVAGAGATTLIGVGSLLGWAVAAFRPTDVSPDVTRAFNDLGWFFFVFDFSPLFVWYVAVALAIFADRGVRPVYPRWAGYLALWVALLSLPGPLMIFFKTGPLAYNGIFAIWIPAGVFFLWIALMTPLTIQAINRRTSP